MPRNTVKLLNHRLIFWCPACNTHHQVSVAETGWTWNGNFVTPTIEPSVLVTSGHYSHGWREGQGCWCTYEGPGKFKCIRCHTFVRNGHIEYLPDSTHVFAGKTVPMVEIDTTWKTCGDVVGFC